MSFRFSEEYFLKIFLLILFRISVAPHKGLIEGSTKKIVNFTCWYLDVFLAAQLKVINEVFDFDFISMVCGVLFYKSGL